MRWTTSGGSPLIASKLSCRNSIEGELNRVKDDLSRLLGSGRTCWVYSRVLSKMRIFLELKMNRLSAPRTESGRSTADRRVPNVGLA